MESRYNPAAIESKWQQVWAEQGLDQTPEDSDKPKFYALSMFPYPSGSLHAGHTRNYVITDVVARLKRMQGYRVLQPMGWDAFGLPAENAAIERGIHPAKWTYDNIAQMKQQLKLLGLSIDWSREITTCSPDYYRWTQWIFLQFLQAELAYQKEAAVNWDPIDQTVLANEQVDSAGRSWRSGAKVERKLLKQWFLKITNYAEQLLQDLDKLTGWPERVKLMQANWIGKSVGAYLEFPITGLDERIGVFTTRPDTVYGVTYVVLAPEHPLTPRVTTSDQQTAVEAFIQEVSAQSELERTAEDKPKRGIPTGGIALNLFTGEEIPIWIADYVLYEYGTGAVMGVPAHDERDFQFAQANNLPIKVVIVPENQESGVRSSRGSSRTARTEETGNPQSKIQNLKSKIEAAYTAPGILVDSGPFNGMASTEAKEAIVQKAEIEGMGKARVQYRLRDWLISRQRYWGTPIPVIHCPNCGTVPVPETDLPVQLPENVAFSGRGPSPLAKLADWINVPCPTCGTSAKRETDTMDTFIDSSWYFLRYPDATNDQQAFDPAKTNDWMPVDQYVGGIEQAILHLLYSRFFTKVLRDSPNSDAPVEPLRDSPMETLRERSAITERHSTSTHGLLNFDEPFQRLLTQGMVQAVTYKNPVTGKYVPPAQVDPAAPKDPETGQPLEVLYEKMSKSKYNGVPPEAVITKYGADTARMFTLFKAPPEKDLEWDDADVEGQFRFLNRVWRLVAEFVVRRGSRAVENYSDQPEDDVRRGFDGERLSRTALSRGVASEFNKPEKDLRRAIHTAIQAVTEDLEGDYQFNTAVSELMKLSNALNDASCKETFGEASTVSGSAEPRSVEASPIYAEGVETLIRLLAPFAPHITEELWQAMGHAESVHTQKWPTADADALVADEVTLVIQINGKTRGTIQVPAGASREAVEQYARESTVAQRYIQDKEIKKVIVVPGKLVNFVVA